VRIKILAETRTPSKTTKKQPTAFSVFDLEHGYTLTEIGRAAALHSATLHRMITAMEKTS
jgi:DNA-binding MarR family transcriptional regulator